VRAIIKDQGSNPIAQHFAGRHGQWKAVRVLWKAPEGCFVEAEPKYVVPFSLLVAKVI
jgi:hypothetical protein